ncbi:MAG TPA: UDP-N-acetylmuramate dehydrogenase [Clostridiaceae bacterium]|nr:UDP-N-acetylmuramate dehydrogenase [Clostridiaceae bacterium]
MQKELVAELIRNIVGKENVLIDEPMSKHTSFKVGGNADLLVLPQNTDQLIEIVQICREREYPFFVMGNGTNLIVKDKGIRGVVIKTFGGLQNFRVCDDMIEAESGILLSKLSNIALKNSLTGLEFASGIPGTLGGAVVMNAGAYYGEMKDVVVWTRYLDRQGFVKEIEYEQHQFGYRTSFIQTNGGIVLKSRLKLRKGNCSEIKALMDDLAKRRKEKQPLDMPSAGSVFKRPEGYYSGQLIESCGLRGYSIGGAQVSNKHCGFIVNNGNATAKDIIALIKFVQDKVKSEFGVELQTEVKIVGED